LGFDIRRRDGSDLCGVRSMTRAQHTIERQDETISDPPPGLIEYEARCAIRDLIRLYGFETARDLIAHFLNDEAEGRGERTWLRRLTRNC